MASAIDRFLSNRTVLAVLMISLTAILAYGVAIPSLGYYYDDWYMLWSGASRGAESLIPLFSTDRPFMGVMYTGFYLLINDNIAGWHLFALAFRVLGACAFYWILNLVWPRQRKSLYILASMLFVVFPGFLAQPNAATKINHLMGYAAALFSIAFTLKAAITQQTSQRRGFAGLALVLLAFYLWIYEYMIGLEVMRLVLLFLVLWQGQAVITARRISRLYIPYLVMIFMFLVWRVLIFDSTRGATNMGGLVRGYLNEPVGMALRLIIQVIKDFFSASLFAWFVQPYTYLSKANFAQFAVAIMMAGFAVLLAVGFLGYMRKRENAEEGSLAPQTMIVTGALITLGAIFPVVLSNRLLDLMDVYKSYALHPSAGALILLLGLLVMLPPKYRSGTMVILLSISMVTQSLNNQRWASLWQVQKNFWWQVSWRAPDIQSNTLVMAHTPDSFLPQQDYEIWGPLNLIYRNERLEWPLIQAEVLNADTSIELYQQIFLEPHVRDIYLPKYYSRFLLFSQPSMVSCVHTIDREQLVFSANERGIVKDVSRYSNPNLVDANATTKVPPENIFGQEPEHGWCYYYQKAALARQIGDWQQIGALYDSVKSGGWKAGDPTEYLVFIEGLVNTGRDSEAAALIETGIEQKSAAHFAICNQLPIDPGYPESFGYRGRDIFILVCETIDH